MPPKPLRRRALPFALLACLAVPPGRAAAAGFSRAEWSNPGQAGSALWIRNPLPRPAVVQAWHVRTLGFRGFGEVAFDAGGRRYRFAVEGDPRGRWVRLVPRGGARLRVRARDSLMLSGFECGERLRAARNGRQAAEEFVLDLRLVDDRGDSSVVKVIQMAPGYRIEEPYDMADSGPTEDEGAGGLELRGRR